MSLTHPWWYDAVVYQVYVRSFADGLPEGAGDGIGDLPGITARLPHLRDPHRPHARPAPTATRARTMLSLAALSAPVPPMLRVCTGVQMFPSHIDDLRYGP